jgi:hypothetical protein
MPRVAVFYRAETIRRALRGARCKPITVTISIATARGIGIVPCEHGALGIHPLVMSPESRPFIVRTHSIRGVCAHPM